MIPYPTADYKKYCFAQALNRMRRIQDIIDALDGIDCHANCEPLNDLGYQFDTLYGCLWRAAFCDDHRQAEAWEGRRMRARVGTDGPDPEIQKSQEAQNTYIDGRTVATTFKFGDREYDWVTHVWHPDPLHPDNRPGAMIEVSQEPYPWSYRYLIVTAPGIIDVMNQEDENDDDIFGDDEEQPC